ncbi:MAG: GT4 family glycosyltransferase PelF [Lachnospiraceae bacterium]|nr:GT4 family glycosyltransferase PelF [Lachnospiraceae bacterium]
MRVCMILEGCYPYVFGGVSSWTHQYIQAMPNVEFVIWCIGAKAEDKGKFKFTMPDNVVEVREVFLDDALRMAKVSGGKIKLNVTKEQIEELGKLFLGQSLNWEILFDMFQNKRINPVDLLMSEDFLQELIKICKENFPYISFVEYFHTIRSMLLPVLYLLIQDVPEADIYHSTATGYGGLLGSIGKWKNNKPFIVTEHGIYTREREEELLRAKWVLPHFRKQWINLFYLFSECAYNMADRVTALFRRANDTQVELGCPREKLRVIQNGVHYDRFCNIPAKVEDGYIDIGAIVRIAKIKDIKTMIYAFAEVKIKVPNARLHIMGDVDDKEYFEECKQLIEQLQTKDIIFTGVVKIIEYIEKIDFVILTSISEGQPLSVLEAFAAGRACVTTDVGCCRDLLEGTDGLGEAGICVPPMHKERLAKAMIAMCQNKEMRDEMAVVGRKRVAQFFTHEGSMEKYRELYKEVL